MLLIIAWVVCVVLMVAGIYTKKNRVYSIGIVTTGTMTIVTPLTYYVEETLRLGAFTASVQDFLLVAGLSTLGGAIITVGLRKLTHQPNKPTLAHVR